jgi:hypothetical protein
MTDRTRPDPDAVPDVDPWVIPLHGASSSPTSADAGATPPLLGIVGPGSEAPPPVPTPAAPLDGYTGPTLDVPQDDDELPTEGFHPRLRRSA